MAAQIPYYSLNTGHKIPSVGLGVWMGKPGSIDTQDRTVQDAIATALQHGYRHIDTAAMYEDEREVGEAVRASPLPRSEIFVTTKLANTERDNADMVRGAFDASLERLDIDYIDAYLMHWPQGVHSKTGKLFGTEAEKEIGLSFNETWAVMEALLQSGKVKNIGVSNFSIENLEKLLLTAKVVPAINQVEGHPYHPDEELMNYCKQKGIHVTYYSPLGQPLGRTDILTDQDLNAIAAETSSTVAQVALSWAVTRGRSVIPKSATPKRIEQNIQLISLTPEQMKRIDGISTQGGERSTRLNIAPVSAETKTVAGWTLEQMGWKVGFLPANMPGSSNTLQGKA